MYKSRDGCKMGLFNRCPDPVEDQRLGLGGRVKGQLRDMEMR